MGLPVVAFVAALVLLVVVARPRRVTSAPPAAMASPGSVTAESVQLRTEASLAASALTTLPRGARVTVTAERGRWLEVRTAAGQVGFLPADTVEADEDRQTRERRARRIVAFPPVFGVVAEDTDILLAPFPLAARAGRLRRGSAVSIHAVDHAYYAFRSAGGGVAFISSADVDLVPQDPRRPAIVPEKARAPQDIEVTDAAPVQTPSAEETEGEAGQGEPPVLLSKVDPRYPEEARRAGVEGTVVLDVTVDAGGDVTDVDVLRGLPLGVSEAAVEAVRHWKYRPAQGPNGPVASRKTLRIVFALNG
ncbi:MAG: TonB family protein [Thermoanaerobaculia bacterium]